MKILIGSDVVPVTENEELFVSGDVRALFGDVVNLTERADRVIINLECALTDSDGAIKKFGPNLKATPGCVNALKKLGVTEVALANNHVFDFGKKGLADTLSALDGADLPYMGIGDDDTSSRAVYTFHHDGKSFGIVNVCEHEYSYALPNRIGANPYDPYLTMQDIRLAKSLCDFVIVLYHGGKEFCRYPSPRLYNLCHEMVLCGADVVITQHSHCVGCYEQFEGGHIVYGQGNFVFCSDTNEEEGWYTALLVELDINKNIGISFYPLVSTPTGCDLAKGEAAKKILADFAVRNEEMKNGKWRDGWHAFCTDPKRVYYHDRILKAAENEHDTQLFAHFLDCEAHTDVWRELYPTWNMTNELEAE
jgi:poly-gamma-glutamate synthesis protein (capsule biosynthesis protein)